MKKVKRHKLQNYRKNSQTEIEGESPEPLQAKKDNKKGRAGASPLRPFFWHAARGGGSIRPAVADEFFHD